MSRPTTPDNNSSASSCSEPRFVMDKSAPTTGTIDMHQSNHFPMDVTSRIGAQSVRNVSGTVAVHTGRRVLGGEEFQKMFRDTISHNMTSPQKETLRKYADPSHTNERRTPKPQSAAVRKLEPARVTQISQMYAQKDPKAKKRGAPAAASLVPETMKMKPLRINEEDGYKMWDELVQCKETLRATLDKLNKLKVEHQKLTERANKIQSEKAEFLTGRKSHDVAAAQLLSETLKCQLLQKKIDQLEHVVQEKDNAMEKIKNMTRTNVARELQVQCETYAAEVARLKHNLEALSGNERVRRHRDEMAMAMSIVDSRERELDNMRKQLRGISVISAPTPAQTTTMSPRPPRDSPKIAQRDSSAVTLPSANEKVNVLEIENDRLHHRHADSGSAQEQIAKLEKEQSNLFGKLAEQTKILETEREMQKAALARMKQEQEQVHSDLVTYLKEKASTAEQRVADLEAKLRQEQALRRKELEDQAERADKKQQMMLETMKKYDERSSTQQTAVLIEKQESLMREVDKLTTERNTLVADKQQLEAELSKYRRELLQPRPMLTSTLSQTEPVELMVQGSVGGATPEKGVVDVTLLGGGRGARYKPENDTMSEITVKPNPGQGGQNNDGDSVVNDYEVDDFAKPLDDD